MKLLFLLLLPLLYSKKPNIILYLADDLGPGEINQQNQEYGFSLKNSDNIIYTPNLEKLAKESTSFHNVWAGSVCSPTRYMLLTGKIGAESDIKGNGYKPTDVNLSLNFPTELKNMGYNTALIGKYGFGDIAPANDIGFNYFYGYQTHVDAHYPFPTVIYENGNVIKFPENANASPKKCINTKKCSYSPDLFLEKSLNFIRSSRDPFFLLFAPINNHVGAWNVKSKVMTSPVNSYGIYSSKKWLKTRKAYAYSTSLIDRDIGKITDLLDSLGLSDNTLLIFTSDNGVEREFTGRNWQTKEPIFFNGSGGRKGTKQSVFEGGVNVGTMIRWPGTIAAGIHNNYPWSLYDVPLALLDIVGADGRVIQKFNTSTSASKAVSVADILTRRAAKTNREWLTSEYCESGICKYAIMNVTSMFKLIFDKEFFAYDIKADPSETINLINKLEQQDTINTMKKVINKIRN